MHMIEIILTADGDVGLATSADGDRLACCCFFSFSYEAFMMRVMLSCCPG